MPNLSRVIAKAVLFDVDNNVLLIRRSKTDDRRPLQWDMPGGMVDEGEDYVSAAIRETTEEVGISVTSDDLHIVYATSDVTNKGNVVWLYFVARTKKVDPTLSYEHDAFEWVPIHKAITMIIYPRQLDVLNYIQKHNLLPPK